MGLLSNLEADDGNFRREERAVGSCTVCLKQHEAITLQCGLYGIQQLGSPGVDDLSDVKGGDLFTWIAEELHGAEVRIHDSPVGAGEQRGIVGALKELLKILSADDLAQGLDGGTRFCVKGDRGWLRGSLYGV